MPEVILSDYFYGQESEEFIYLFQNPSPVDYRSEIQARFHRRQAALRYAAGPHGPVREK